MDQRHFDFAHDESHALFLQLDNDKQQSLIDQMASLIIAVFYAQETINHDQSQHANQD